MNVDAGTLIYSNNLTNPGTLSVAPGARMNVGGSFTNGAQGTVRIGLANATTTGLLAVTGTANLAGTLAVYLAGGYVPDANAVFGVMTYANRTGAFSILRGESPGALMDFTVDTATDPKTLKIQNITVTTVLPGVDLVVTGLGLSADTVLQSGNSVTVEWLDNNTGTLATTTSWTDRLVVRNLDTNEVLADLQIPYDATASGAIAGGGSAARQASFVLPQGPRGAGHLSFTVTVDLANDVVETNIQGVAELNNTASPEPDLGAGALSRPGSDRCDACTGLRLASGRHGDRELDDAQPGRRRNPGFVERDAADSQSHHRTDAVHAGCAL